MTDISECLGVSCPDDIISADLATRLKDTKTLIDDESVKVKWDIAKRLVNPYELVGLSRIQNENGHFQNVGVSRIRPLSRAFFKFVELSANFNIHMAWDKPVTTLHLAEGPGGFIQAWDYLRLQMGLCDNICGITLIQRENDAVPGWRRSREFLRQHSNIHTLVGETGNGDLTLTANINYLRRHFSGNRPMLVTGDGGFDVSDNFNNQESDMFLLILSQTLCALETLNVGGIFLLKIFDTFTRPMMDLLWVLKGSFKKVLLEKPLTSRPANSEKQLICKGFVEKPADVIMERLHGIRERLVREKACGRVLQTQKLLNEPPPPTWRNSFQELTKEFAERQIRAIVQTVELSRQLNNSRANCSALVTKNQNEQRRLSIAWCRKYKIPVHQDQFIRHPALN